MEVKVINKSKNKLPEYGTSGSAGCDLMADFSNVDTIIANNAFITRTEDGSIQHITIRPGGRALIPTNLFTSIPEGYEVQVRSRSGLALKHGIFVLNSPGTIDADYRGEICVELVNLSNISFTVEPGERIAQLVFAKYEKADFIEVEELNETERGEGGFGHTGNK